MKKQNKTTTMNSPKFNLLKSYLVHMPKKSSKLDKQKRNYPYMYIYY